MTPLCSLLVNTTIEDTLEIVDELLDNKVRYDNKWEIQENFQAAELSSLTVHLQLKRQVIKV